MSMGADFAIIGSFVEGMTVDSTGPNGIILQGGTMAGCIAGLVGGGGMTINAPSLQIIGGTAPATDAIIGTRGAIVANISGDVRLITSPGVGGGAFIANFIAVPIQIDLNIGGTLSMQSFGSPCFIVAGDPSVSMVNIQAANLSMSSFSNSDAFISVENGDELTYKLPFNGFEQYLGWPSLFVMYYDLHEEEIAPEPYVLRTRSTRLIKRDARTEFPR